MPETDDLTSILPTLSKWQKELSRATERFRAEQSRDVSTSGPSSRGPDTTIITAAERTRSLLLAAAWEMEERIEGSASAAAAPPARQSVRLSLLLLGAAAASAAAAATALEAVTIASCASSWSSTFSTTAARTATARASLALSLPAALALTEVLLTLGRILVDRAASLTVRERQRAVAGATDDEATTRQTVARIAERLVDLGRDHRALQQTVANATPAS